MTLSHQRKCRADTDKENCAGSFAQLQVESPSRNHEEVVVKKKLMFDMAFSAGVENAKTSRRRPKTPISKTPIPSKELPMREALTPRDAEAREYKRHIAALRLQTLLHRRRAQRAFSRSIKLERELRRGSSLSTTSSEGQAVVEEALKLAQAEKAALEAQLDAERAKWQVFATNHTHVEDNTIDQDKDYKAQLEAVASELEETKAKAQVQSEAFDACKLQAEATAQAANAQIESLENTSALQAQFLEEARRILSLSEDRTAAAEAAAMAALALYKRLEHSLDSDRAKWDAVRRKMHNNVVELKGNIRTFVRVRPPLEHAHSSHTNFMTNKAIPAATQSTLISYPPPSATGADLIAIPEPIAPGGPPRQRRAFTFAVDRVFKPEAEQADIFAEVDAFVQSAVDGYKVCVFAYGQTGSGKTYTVVGTEDQEHQGLLGRALDMAFNNIADLSRLDSRWHFELSVEAYEIYLDKVYDLLVSDNERKALDTAANSTDKTITIRGLTSAPVASSHHAQCILARAAAKRRTNATKSNATSSRSHCVFSLHLNGKHPDLPQGRHGLLNLVDLAGSERLKISGSSDNPSLLREAQNINTSLSSLASTIGSLVNKDPHVPFRDSKLTFLLSPCLGGDSKTLAIFNIAPEPQHHRETVCTLRFAQQVSKCITGNHHTSHPQPAGLSSSTKDKKNRRASCVA